MLFSLKFLDWQDVDLGGDRFGLHGLWLDSRGLGFIDVYRFLGLFWDDLRERSLERVPESPGGKGFLNWVDGKSWKGLRVFPLLRLFRNTIYTHRRWWRDEVSKMERNINRGRRRGLDEGIFLMSPSTRSLVGILSNSPAVHLIRSWWLDLDSVFWGKKVVLLRVLEKEIVHFLLRRLGLLILELVDVVIREKNELRRLLLLLLEEFKRLLVLLPPEVLLLLLLLWGLHSGKLGWEERHIVESIEGCGELMLIPVVAESIVNFVRVIFLESPWAEEFWKLLLFWHMPFSKTVHAGIGVHILLFEGIDLDNGNRHGSIESHFLSLLLNSFQELLEESESVISCSGSVFLLD